MNLKTSGEDLLTNLAAIKDEGEYFLLTVPLSLGPKSGLYLFTYYHPSTIRETVASKRNKKNLLYLSHLSLLSVQSCGWCPAEAGR